MVVSTAAIMMQNQNEHAQLGMSSPAGCRRIASRTWPDTAGVFVS
jgi:hypothetical protein